ncbi:MAG: YdcF family protein [Bryobacteraceae bacterium]|nr:YdcF family protein [Bryobacteraceae bacterium]
MTYLQPVIPLLIVLLVLGLSRRSSRTRSQRNALIVFVASVLFLWSWPPVVRLTSATLEWPYPASDLPSGDAEAIVVLTGGIDEPFPTQPEVRAEESTYRRAIYAAWLYTHWKPLPVLASGGPMGRKGYLAAEVAGRLLAGHGVPESMIWTERRSRSTAENARFCAEALRARGVSRIVLVTDGFHMLRAERCFRKQGLAVTPAPCYMRRARPLSRWTDFVPKAEAILDNEAVLHEWLGLAWYWVRGEI